jgi:diacylglycerol kinase family enzyme
MSDPPAPPGPGSGASSAGSSAGSPAERLERRIAVVVNGNAKSVTEEIIATLDQILAGGDLFVSKHIEESEDIARTVVDRGYGTVLTGGGDGTFTVMVSAVVKEADRRGLPRPRFGLLRLGTGNALAWVVGASKAAEGRGLAADIQRLRKDAGFREMRLIEVEGTLAPFCGFGVDALVLSDYQRTKAFLAKGPLKKLAPGPLAYVVSTVTQSIPANVFRAVPRVKIINNGSPAFRLGERGRPVGEPVGKGEVLHEGKVRIVAVGTIPYYGFGFRMFPFADDRPDRMQLRVSTIPSHLFVANFAAIWRGDYYNPACVFDYLVDDVVIEMEPETPFQIGGDAIGSRKQISLRLQPEPIRLVDFYAPPSGLAGLSGAGGPPEFGPLRAALVGEKSPP